MGRAIRRFVAGDDANLITAINEVCSEGRWMSTRRYEPTTAWTHALLQPNCSHHSLLVVEANQALVGWCRLFPIQSCNGFQPEASLGIGLVQPYRDRGIGTSLLHESLQWALIVGVQRVTLSARVDNARAIHVFEKCGFRSIGYTADAFLKMECELCSP
jgi:RimJ/RimL family protein N-acetyltransferase